MSRKPKLETVTLSLNKTFALSLFVACVLCISAVNEAAGSAPSAACPGTSSATSIATTTTAGSAQQPGDTSTGTPIVPGSTALTTTTATTAPAMPVYEIVPESVSINDAAEFTSSLGVSVSIVGPGGWKGTMGAATRAELSNDGGFKSSKFFDLLNSRATVDWTLEAGREGTFTKIVYVRFWNCYGSPAFGASTLTDDIILDNTRPVLASALAVASSGRGGIEVARLLLEDARRSTVRLALRGSDSISGVGSIEIRSSARQAATVIEVRASAGVASSKARAMTKSVTLSTLAKRFQVRLVDRAGNASNWKLISIAG